MQFVEIVLFLFARKTGGKTQELLVGLKHNLLDRFGAFSNLFLACKLGAISQLGASVSDILLQIISNVYKKTIVSDLR